MRMDERPSCPIGGCLLSALSGAEKSLLRDTQPALTAAIATLLSSSELVGQDLFRLTTHLLAVRRT